MVVECGKDFENHRTNKVLRRRCFIFDNFQGDDRVEEVGPLITAVAERRIVPLRHSIWPEPEFNRILPDLSFISSLRLTLSTDPLLEKLWLLGEDNYQGYYKRGEIAVIYTTTGLCLVELRTRRGLLRLSLVKTFNYCVTETKQETKEILKEPVIKV